MVKNYLFGKCVLLLLVMISTSGTIAVDEPAVLIFSKTNGYYHESIPDGQAAIRKLGREHGFRVDTTTDSSFFHIDKLKSYAALIFLNTTLDVLGAQEEKALEDYIHQGGGYVGVHAATDTEFDWPWYGRLAGAFFNGHPEQQEAIIRVTDRTHSSTKHLPETWKRKDEWYNFKDINPDLKVLMYLDESSYTGGTNGASHPIAWYHEFEGGRAWYTGLGHTKESYTDPLFLTHLLGGIQYAIGR